MAVRAGDFVLLECSDGSYNFAEAKKGSKIRVQRGQCKAEALIGAAFYETFNVRGNDLVRAESTTFALPGADDSDLGAGLDAAGLGIDNRDLIDDNKNQKVDCEAIQRMRSEKVSGEAIIGALIAGSDSFDKKTKFAQEKWLRRKEKKYMPWVRVLPPTAHTIAAAYFSKNAQKIKQLRPDTLAQMLSNGNVHAGASVVVFDEVAGLVVGAVMERLGGFGFCFVPHVGKFASIDAVRRFNFEKQVSSTLAPYRIVCDDADIPAKRLPGAGSCDSLIIASHFDPTSSLEQLLPLLKPSCPFVVYSEFQEPLLKAFKWLQAGKKGVHLIITNTWLRAPRRP